jgi:hypothetical protein
MVVRREIIVPTGRSARAGDRRRFGGLADVGENPLQRRGLGHESDDAHVRPAVGAGQRQRLELFFFSYLSPTLAMNR